MLSLQCLSLYRLVRRHLYGVAKIQWINAMLPDFAVSYDNSDSVGIERSPTGYLNSCHNKWYAVKQGSDERLVDTLWPKLSEPIKISQSTHWDRVTHIYVSKLTSIGSDRGLSLGRRQAIIWTNVGIFLIGPLGTNCGEILIKIYTFSFK